MQIEIRSTDRLRGTKALDLAPVLTSLGQAAHEGSIDLARLRVVCDWVQYKQNFRGPVDVRRIVPHALEAVRAQRNGASGANGNEEEREAYEIVVDLRRAASIDFAAQIACAFAPAHAHDSICDHRQYLEDWGPVSASRMWGFNGLYWNYLGLWERATGHEYEQALPGGESDARNTAAARELILELFRLWDGLAARRALPEDLHVLELGVGNGNQARVWLDEFLRLDREHHGEYYRRLHYLMGDYSPHVLERARDNVRHHAEHVSSLVLDARSPSATLGFLRSKAFLIYISNVYDNLPTDEIVRLGGHLFQVEVRAYLPGPTTARIAAELGVCSEEVPELVNRLLQLGPELLAAAAPERFPGGVPDAVDFWRAAWEGVRLQERYVPIEELDIYAVAPGIGGELLRPIVEANGDVRMHVSNGAAASFVDSLPLLHPFGSLQCHDLFITDIEQYHTAFRGPGKYDGSVVNWVNGPLLAALGRRHGFDVHFQAFAHRMGSNVTTLTARVRE
jgi:hypothetical protein